MANGVLSGSVCDWWLLIGRNGWAREELEHRNPEASERLTSMYKTVPVIALGLLALALGSGEAGREIEGPMAIII